MPRWMLDVNRACLVLNAALTVLNASVGNWIPAIVTACAATVNGLVLWLDGDERG